MDKIKEEKYDMLYRQIASLIDGESNATGILANVSAAIHTTMDFWWTGFYLVSNGELQLGPFQGPVACMHIQYGRGVCGTAWKEKQTIVVGDVEQFPGHLRRHRQDVAGENNIARQPTIILKHTFLLAFIV